MELFLCTAYIARRFFRKRKLFEEGFLRHIDGVQLRDRLKAYSGAGEEGEAEFCGLLRVELDTTWTAFDVEARSLLYDFSKVETAAGQYNQAAKGGEGREEKTEKVDSRDAYAKEKINSALVSLHRRAVELINFKMATYRTIEEVLDGLDNTKNSVRLLAFSHPLFVSRVVTTVMDDIEKLYSALFCHGNVEVGRCWLQQRAGETLENTLTFGFGLRMGMAFLLSIWVLWDCVIDDAFSFIWHDPSFRIYRGLGNIVLLFWVSGGAIFIWYKMGIDYASIMDFDPKVQPREMCSFLWNKACDLSIAFLVGLLVFYKALR